MNFVIWFYTLVGAMFCFATVYSFAVWWQVRGLTGLMQVFLFSALAWLSFSSMWAASPHARISMVWIIASQRAALSVAALAAFVLADQYAARRNSHRALTTVAYLWFMKISEERRNAT